MRIKRVLLVFLFLFAVIIIAFSVATYAYVYMSSLASTNTGSSLQQYNSASNSESAVQNTQAQQIESTDTSSGNVIPRQYNGSIHLYGTWNNPSDWGIGGYNYNDPQDYAGTETTSFSPLR